MVFGHCSWFLDPVCGVGLGVPSATFPRASAADFRTTHPMWSSANQRSTTHPMWSSTTQPYVEFLPPFLCGVPCSKQSPGTRPVVELPIGRGFRAPGVVPKEGDLGRGGGDPGRNSPYEGDCGRLWGFVPGAVAGGGVG